MKLIKKNITNLITNSFLIFFFLGYNVYVLCKKISKKLTAAITPPAIAKFRFNRLECL